MARVKAPRLLLNLCEEQKVAKDLVSQRPVNFILGKAGSGKTFLACYIALSMLGDRTKIVITRPTVGTEDNGFIPGTLDDKLEPWMVPIKDNFKELLGAEVLKKMETEHIIEIVSLQHFRGRTFKNAICIVDECLPKETRIKTETGIENIQSIINEINKGNTVKVLSYNETEDIFEYKPVESFKKTENREIVQVHFKDTKIKCTDNHRILTTSGYKMAKDLVIGDVGIFWGRSNKSSLFIDNDDLKDIIVGSLMGDGHAQDLKSGIFRMMFTHGLAQQEYCDWKCKMLHGQSRIVKNGGYAKNLSCVGKSPSLFIPDLDVMDKIQIINNITWKSLAISWMDDGSIFKTMNGGSLWSFPLSLELTTKLADKLNGMGLETKICLVKNKYYKINFNKKSIIMLSEKIAMYLHNSLAYKITPEFRHLCETYEWNNTLKNFTVKPFTKFVNTEEFSDVFDIGVSDNHNFVIQNSALNTSGLVVHNCQNLKSKQLAMVIGRLGIDSTMILCGDKKQVDVKEGGVSVIKKMELLKDCRFVNIITLLENHRHPALDEILDLLDE